MALDALGITYRFVAARPMFYPARRPKTHMALIAEVDDRLWLCDLGFGSYGIRAPLAIDMTDTDIEQDFDTFRLIRDVNNEYLLQAKVEGAWANQYSFDLSPRSGLISSRPTTSIPPCSKNVLSVRFRTVGLQTPNCFQFSLL